MEQRWETFYPVKTQLFILLKDCINFLLHLFILLSKIHEVLATTNNIPHQHCQVQYSRQQPTHLPWSLISQEIWNECCWLTFLGSGLFERFIQPSEFSLITFFFVVFNQSSRQMWPVPVAPLASVELSTLLPPPFSSALCHWLHLPSPCPLFPPLCSALYSIQTARGLLQGSSKLQSFNNPNNWAVPWLCSQLASPSSMLTLTPSSSFLLITWASLIPRSHNLSSSNLSH